MTQPFDTLLRGGRVIDPAQNIDAQLDVGIRDGKIVALAAGLTPSAGTSVIDVKGKLVLPGLIDTHAHVYQYVTGTFGLNPDLVGVRSGVTTLVDQGGPSCMTLPGFRKFIVEPAKSRVVAFISSYLAGGLEGHLYPDLYQPSCVNVEHTVRVALENPDIVRGVKAHAEIGGASRWGVEVMKLSAQIGREAKLPVYVHLGQLWPTKDHMVMDADELVRQVVPLVKAGDVLAHPFTRHPGGFINAEGKVHPIVWEAIERGVRVDVGHGSHFSFDMARKAIAAGIVPFTLGADLHGLNVRPPEDNAFRMSEADRQSNPFFGVAAFGLTHAMTELLTLGLSLNDVVKTVTCNAAELVNMSDSIGSLALGRNADVSVIDMLSGKFTLQDNLRVKVSTERYLSPVFCMVAGQRYDADSPILPMPMAA
ncbi:MAG: amidohydrolase/deacetylase family metallohydrolase [Betaproteobacteria bacterium]